MANSQQSDERQVETMALHSWKPYPTDHNFFRIPLKNYTDSIVNFQDRLKRDVSILTNFLEKKILNENDTATLLDRLDKALKKLEHIYYLAEVEADKSTISIEELVARIGSVAAHTHQDTSDKNVVEKNNLFRTDCAVLEYLARKGFNHTAMLLATKKDIMHMCDLMEYKEYSKVKSALENKDLTEALNWCQKNRSKFNNSEEMVSFEVDLHLLHIIELGKENQFREALDHLKAKIPEKYIADSQNVKKAMFFITFRDMKLASLKNLSWEKLILKFDSLYHSIVKTPPFPTIEILVQLGIACIKTNDCAPELSYDCPTCDPDWNAYAKALPSSQHSVNSIYCPTTGEHIGSENGAFLFSEDKRVYSKNAMDEMLRQNDELETSDFIRLYLT